MLNKILTAALIVGLAIPAIAQERHNPAEQPEVLSLDRALRLALQNNSALLSAEQDVIIAEQQEKEARYRFFPQALLSGTATKSNLKYPIVETPDFGSHIIYPTDSENFYTARVSMVEIEAIARKK